jgi:hypothetical protein
MLRQSKEKIPDAMPRRQTPVNKFPVITVDEVFFTRSKRKIASYFRSWRKDAVQQHIRAEVHVLMAIYAQWWPPIKPPEFFGLRFEDFPKGAPQKWVVKQQRVFASAKEFTDALMLASNLLRNVRTGETLCEINMQADVESGRCCQRGGAFRVLHEDHGTRGSDPPFHMADKDAISGKTVPSKIIGIDNEHVMRFNTKATLDSASVSSQAAEYLSQPRHLLGTMKAHQFVGNRALTAVQRGPHVASNEPNAA